MADLVVEQAVAPAEWAEVAQLIRTYVAGLPFELDFQDVDEELRELTEVYVPPTGAGLLARAGDGGLALGFVGVRRFTDDDAEMKRMFVTPEARGRGAGRALAEASVLVARALGYRRLLLDTVASLTSAIAIYEGLGFVPVDPYRHNPRPDARFFGLDL